MSKKIEQLELHELKKAFRRTLQAQTGLRDEELQYAWLYFWIELKKHCSVVEKQ